METPEAPENGLSFLIRRARAGDSDAFERLVRLYRDRIFRWALVRTGDVDDAEDATQETLVRLHLGLRKFRGASRFETWLYAITRNAAADLGRRRRSRERVTDKYARLSDHGQTSPGGNALDALSSRQMADRVREFLVQLPVRQREAVDLVDLQGLLPAEAATLLGANPATLRTHLLRGRRALRERLARVTRDEAGS